AFVAPIRPAVPEPKDKAWVKNPIDAFLLASLEREGLAPNPPAPPHALLRRLSLDLTGLPPHAVNGERLMVNGGDETPSAVHGSPFTDDEWEALVNRYLSAPHYGERMALPWLDA